MSVRVNVAARSQVDRWLLLVPAVAGVLFGLGPYLLSGGFGRLFGYPGNDDYLYHLAGAATIGYPFGLILGLRQRSVSALRLPVLATLTFNVASLYACAVQIFGGAGTPIIYLVTVASALNAAIAANFLARYPREPQPAADISSSQKYAFAIGAVLAALFGLVPLLIPALSAQLVGFKGTDVFLIRQAGAASLGYGVMAVAGFRSGVWQEVWLASVMALVFNGFAFVASLIALLSGDPIFISALIGAASLANTIFAIVALQRRGRV